MAKREPEPQDPQIEDKDDSDDPTVAARRMLDALIERIDGDSDDPNVTAKRMIDELADRTEGRDPAPSPSPPEQ